MTYYWIGNLYFIQQKKWIFDLNFNSFCLNIIYSNYTKSSLLIKNFNLERII